MITLLALISVGLALALGMKARDLQFEAIDFGLANCKRTLVIVVVLALATSLSFTALSRTIVTASEEACQQLLTPPS